MPGPDFGAHWNVGVNCYCYAVHHQATPGGKKLEPGELSGEEWERGRDAAHFWALVQRDGAISVSPQYTANPGAMPAANSNPGHYLIALKLNSTGFVNYHAMRRDEASGDWWYTSLGWSMLAQQVVIMRATGMQTPHTQAWTPGNLAAIQPLDVWIGYFWIPNLGLQTAPARRRGGCCYISTATCRSMGLPDDCEELQTLRWFRDHIMQRTPRSRRDVEAYYASAPAIVDAIDARVDASVIYADMFENGIRPAVAAVKRGDFDAAYAIFREHVERLHAYVHHQVSPRSSPAAPRNQFV